MTTRRYQTASRPLVLTESELLAIPLRSTGTPPSIRVEAGMRWRFNAAIGNYLSPVWMVWEAFQDEANNNVDVRLHAVMIKRK